MIQIVLTESNKNFKIAINNYGEVIEIFYIFNNFTLVWNWVENCKFLLEKSSKLVHLQSFIIVTKLLLISLGRLSLH